MLPVRYFRSNKSSLICLKIIRLSQCWDESGHPHFFFILLHLEQWCLSGKRVEHLVHCSVIGCKWMYHYCGCSMQRILLSCSSWIIKSSLTSPTSRLSLNSTGMTSWSMPAVRYFVLLVLVNGFLWWHHDLLFEWVATSSVQLSKASAYHCFYTNRWEGFTEMF